ncbi:MAG TPA: PD-(D/E)XK nuclease family protein [Acidimicrobiia bacterium]|nr:PD-(D/E)XK nuclease family protein [Acidimicrobiia bacterium]
MLVSIPHVIPGDEIRVSATTYVAWKKCPDSANVKLQGIYGPDSKPAFVGSLAHRIFSRHLTGGPIASDDFVQACREEIGASNLNNKLGGLEIKPSVLAGVIEEVRGLYERFVNFPGEGFESSEVAVDIEADGDIRLLGTIDAVYREDLGGHRLVDWKTGEIGDAEDQLLFYSFLWAMEKDELPAYVEAVSVRTGERYRTVPSSDDVRRVSAEVGDLVNEIRRAWNEGSALERRGGPWCRYCPILEDCPEGSSATALLG